MKKVLLVVALLSTLAFAQKSSDPMPADSPQYKLAQEIVSAIHGFEEPCPEITEPGAKEYQALLWTKFSVIQGFCGGYFAETSQPLEEIDLLMVSYKAKIPWQKTALGYARLFEFGRGELLIGLSDNDESMFLSISYREPKD